MTETQKITPQSEMTEKLQKEIKHQYSIGKLRDFVNTNHEGVSNSDDLSKALAGTPESLLSVARSIKTRLIAHGGVMGGLRYNDTYGLMSNSDEITGQCMSPNADHFIELSWNREQVTIYKYQMPSTNEDILPIYLITIPRKLAPTKNAVYEPHADVTGQDKIYPWTNNTREEQQKYISFATEGIKDLLTILPPK